MSCAGNPDLSTPAMDQLASEGVRFTRMYCSSPVCCPARSSMATGFLPHNTGVHRNGLRLRHDVPTIAEILSAAGYFTGHIGKWHLDGGGGGAIYAPVPPERHRGYRYWAGFEHGHDYFNARYYTDFDKPISFSDGTYEPDGQTDLAIEFIEQHKDEPWYLDLSFGPPHLTDPLDEGLPGLAELANIRTRRSTLPDPSLIGLSPNVPADVADEAREALAGYYAMIENLDWNLGRLIDTLVEHGLLDRTIVVFTSDHGDMMLSHGMHFKRRPQEEAVRIPFLMRYPSAIASGMVYHQLASQVDIVPTLLDLMGLSAPSSDGVSHAPWLCAEAAVEVSSPQPGCTRSSTAQARGSVYIEGDWLGCRSYDPEHLKAPWRAVVTERHKACYVRESKSIRLVYLFDLVSDPYELHNLADLPDSRPVQAAMAQLIGRWAKETGDMEWMDVY